MLKVPIAGCSGVGYSWHYMLLTCSRGCGAVRAGLDDMDFGVRLTRGLVVQGAASYIAGLLRSPVLWCLLSFSGSSMKLCCLMHANWGKSFVPGAYLPPAHARLRRAVCGQGPSWYGPASCSVMPHRGWLLSLPSCPVPPPAPDVAAAARRGDLQATLA